MKNIIASIVIATVTATTAMATQNVADLTNDQQAAVRLGECSAINTHLAITTPFDVYLDPTFGKLYNNLTKKGQKFATVGKGPYKQVIRDARADTEVAIILGDLEVTPASLVACGEDAKLIARDDYLPNFIINPPEDMPETEPAHIPLDAPMVDYLTEDDIYKNLGKNSTEVQRQAFFEANKGKKVVFTGTVITVDSTSWLLGPVVGFKTDYTSNVGVDCLFPKDEDHRVANISKGDTFTCEGTLGSYVFAFGGGAVSITAK